MFNMKLESNNNNNANLMAKASIPALKEPVVLLQSLYSTYKSRALHTVPG